jgi:DNA-binding transcriptional MerR regulator
MTLSPEPLWTLDELCAQVALALARDYPGQASGRVREVPDRRTIRFYTTLGLVDRPARHPSGRGRAALYGLRHLRQLVAIKRLQADGFSLTEVQARLVGQTDAVLAELARLPGVPPEPDPELEDRREGAFWKESPAPAAGEDGRAEGVGPLSGSPKPGPLVGVPLADGATLLVGAARPLDDHDVEALRAAAAPLLRLLEARRILPGGA